MVQTINMLIDAVNRLQPRPGSGTLITDTRHGTTTRAKSSVERSKVQQSDDRPARWQ